MRLGLPLPIDWSTPSVDELFDQLQGERAEAELAHERAVKWSGLERERQQLNDQSDELAIRRDELQRDLGIDFAYDAEGLRELVDAIKNWRSAMDDCIAAEAEVEMSDRQIVTLLRDLNRDLQRYGEAQVETAIAATGAIEHLDERIARAREALRTQQLCRQQIDHQHAPDRDRAAAEIRAVFAQLDLQDGADLALERLCARVPDFKRAHETVREERIRLSEARDRLEADPALVEADRFTIETELSDARLRADRREELQDQISSIEADVRRAKSETRLESALDDQVQALDDLRSAWRKDQENVAGWLLGDFVHRRTRDIDRPQVFLVARDYFSQFTSGEFRLEIDHLKEDEFVAVHTQTEEIRTMEQLSSGTRVQLLLAVRLAFIETLEDGLRLPLVLDETLGNSDDFRANAIIDATIEISRKGRQILYFTAQPDEIAKWADRLGELADPLPSLIIDLDKARTGDRAASSIQFAPDRQLFEPIVLPEGTDHTAARTLLNVPPIDPWAETLGGIDLWYFIFDVPTLVRLRNLRVFSFGQYRQQGRRLADRIEQFDDVDRRVQQLARVVEGALRCLAARARAADDRRGTIEFKLSYTIDPRSGAGTGGGVFLGWNKAFSTRYGAANAKGFEPEQARRARRVSA